MDDGKLDRQIHFVHQVIAVIYQKKKTGKKKRKQIEALTSQGET